MLEFAFFFVWETASSLVGFNGGTSYSITVAPKEPGPVTVNLPVGAVYDKANNDNKAPASITFTYTDAGPKGIEGFDSFIVSHQRGFLKFVLEF